MGRRAYEIANVSCQLIAKKITCLFARKDLRNCPKASSTAPDRFSESFKGGRKIQKIRESFKLRTSSRV